MRKLKMTWREEGEEGKKGRKQVVDLTGDFGQASTKT